MLTVIKLLRETWDFLDTIKTLNDQNTQDFSDYGIPNIEIFCDNTILRARIVFETE